MVLRLKTRESKSPPGLLNACVNSLGCIFIASGRTIGAGWSSPVARQAHNLKVAGSNPAPATNDYSENPALQRGFSFVRNLPAHKATGVRQVIEGGWMAGIYSPDFNPIVTPLSSGSLSREWETTRSRGYEPDRTRRALMLEFEQFHSQGVGCKAVSTKRHAGDNGNDYFITNGYAGQILRQGP